MAAVAWTSIRWPSVLVVTLCALVHSSADSPLGLPAQPQDSQGCSLVKSAYSGKGYNRNDVPGMMISGECSVKMGSQLGVVGGDGRRRQLLGPGESGETTGGR